MRILFFLCFIFPLFVCEGVTWEQQINGATAQQQLSDIEATAKKSLTGRTNLKTLKQVIKMIGVRSAELRGSDIVGQTSRGEDITVSKVKQQLAQAPQKSAQGTPIRNVGKGPALQPGQKVVTPDGRGGFLDEGKNRYVPEGKISSSSSPITLTQRNDGTLVSSDGTIYSSGRSSSSPRARSRSSSTSTQSSGLGTSRASTPRASTSPTNTKKLKQDEEELTRIDQDSDLTNEQKFQEILEYFFEYFQVCTPTKHKDCEDQAAEWYLNFKAGRIGSQLKTPVIFSIIQNFVSVNQSSKEDQLKIFADINDNASPEILNEFFRRYNKAGEEKLKNSLADLYEKLLSMPTDQRKGFLKDTSEKGILSLIPNPDIKKPAGFGRKKKQAAQSPSNKKEVLEAVIGLPEVSFVGNQFTADVLRKHPKLPALLMNSSLLKPVLDELVKEEINLSQKGNEIKSLKTCLYGLFETLLQPLRMHKKAIEDREQKLSSILKKKEAELKRLRGKKTGISDALQNKIKELEDEIESEKKKAYKGVNKNPVITLGFFSENEKKAAQEAYKSSGDVLKTQKTGSNISRVKTPPMKTGGIPVPPPPPPPIPGQGGRVPPPPPPPGVSVGRGQTSSPSGENLEPVTARDMTRTYEEWVAFVPNKDMDSKRLYVKILHYLLTSGQAPGTYACLSQLSQKSSSQKSSSSNSKKSSTSQHFSSSSSSAPSSKSGSNLFGQGNLRKTPQKAPSSPTPASKKRGGKPNLSSSKRSLNVKGLVEKTFGQHVPISSFQVTLKTKTAVQTSGFSVGIIPEKLDKSEIPQNLLKSLTEQVERIAKIYEKRDHSGLQTLLQRYKNKITPKMIHDRIVEQLAKHKKHKQGQEVSVTFQWPIVIRDATGFFINGLKINDMGDLQYGNKLTAAEQKEKLEKVVETYIEFLKTIK